MEYNYYQISGIVIRSSIDLQYLKKKEASSEHHVDLMMGKAEFHPDADEKVFFTKIGGFPIAATADKFFLKIFGIALFSIENKGLIIMELLDDSTVEKALPFFYGTVLTVLLHTHKLFPMHASAVLSKDGINIFCAASGTGKSTLAFNLYSRGYPLFSDDKCIFEWDNILKKYTSTPSIRAMRLWQNSIDDADNSSQLEDGVPVIHNDEKFQFNMDNQMYDRIHMLHQMFVIRKVDDLKEIKIRPLRLKEKQAAIKNQIHRPKLIFGEEIKAKFEKYVKNFSRLVPIYFVQKPSAIPINEFADFMEAQILEKH